jgi:hypothetical protein
VVNDGGLVLLALVLIVVPGLFAARAVSRRARGAQGQPRARGGGIVSGWLAHRRALRLKEHDRETGMLRDKAKHEHRLREQAERDRRAADRARGGKTVPGEAWTTEATDQPWPESPSGDRPAGRWTAMRPRWIRLRPESPPPGAGSRPPGPQAPPGGGPGGPAAPPAGTPRPPGSPVTTDGPGARRPPGPARTPEPPARGANDPRPAPGPTEPDILEGVIVTTLPDTPGTLAVPGVEMIIEGANALRRYMLAGNALAKLRGVAGIEAAGDCLAGTVTALAREMSEPAQHYGHEVTEPLAMSAVHFSAASLGLAEVEGRLRAVIRAAEELRASGVQAPHHEQFQVQ